MLQNALITTICSQFYPILTGMHRPRIIYCVPALFLLYTLPGTATTVYKSIDESGVVSFSDTVIKENEQLEEVTIDIEATPPDDQAEQRLEDMRETTDRMAADRMAREKHRAEMRELQAKADAVRTPQYYSDDYQYQDYRTVYTGGSYGYYRYPYRRHYRKHHGRPRPEHPIARPPLRPHTRPAYRDKFPAPHIRPLFTPRTRGAPHR